MASTPEDTPNQTPPINPVARPMFTLRAWYGWSWKVGACRLLLTVVYETDP
jgi:hypothetical protein